MVEGTSITAHLEADSNAAREAADLAAANLEMSRQYADFGGAFHLLKFDRKGEAKPIRLCNFTAEIEREVVKNDGLTTSRHFKVSGRLETGEAMPTIDVPASEFDRLDWLPTSWGASAQITVGSRFRGPRRSGHQRNGPTRRYCNFANTPAGPNSMMNSCT